MCAAMPAIFEVVTLPLTLFIRMPRFDVGCAIPIGEQSMLPNITSISANGLLARFGFEPPIGGQLSKVKRICLFGAARIFK